MHGEAASPSEALSERSIRGVTRAGALIYNADKAHIASHTFTLPLKLSVPPLQTFRSASNDCDHLIEIARGAPTANSLDQTGNSQHAYKIQ
jgi:hypothetical protein